MLYRETTAVFAQIHTKHKNTLCARATFSVFNAKTSGIYGHRSALRSYVPLLCKKAGIFTVGFVHQACGRRDFGVSTLPFICTRTPRTSCFCREHLVCRDLSWVEG